MPRNRATRSEKRANESGSIEGRRKPADRGRSRRRPEYSSGITTTVGTNGDATPPFGFGPGRPHQRYRSAWSVVSCPVQALSAEALSRNNQAFVQLAEARLDKVAVTISAKSDGDRYRYTFAGQHRRLGAYPGERRFLRVMGATRAASPEAVAAAPTEIQPSSGGAPRHRARAECPQEQLRSRLNRLDDDYPA